MSLLIEIGVQSLEALFVVAAIVACFSLFRGYAADKRLSRMFFGAAFLAAAGIFASLLTAQALAVYGNAVNASPLVHLLVVQAAMVAFGVVASLSGRRRQIWAAISVVAALASVVLVSRWGYGWTSVGTVVIPDLRSPGVAAAAIVFAVASALVGLPGLVTLLRRESSGKVGSMIAFAVAGFIAVAVGLYCVFAGGKSAPLVVGTGYLLISISQFFGAIGTVSREERVSGNPLNYFGDDLVNRLSLLTATVFWVIVLCGSLSFLSVFASIQREADIIQARETLGDMAQDYVWSRNVALEDVIWASRSLTAALVGQRADRAARIDLRSLVPADRYFSVRLTDSEGRIISSDLPSDIVGSSVPLNATLAKAAAGFSVASLEIEPVLERNLIMAAAPVTAPSGETWVLAVSSEWLGDSLGDVGADMPSIGYGLVNTDDQEILTVGKPLLQEDWQDRTIDRNGTETADLGGTPALVLAVFSTGGEPAGSFYVLLPFHDQTGQLRQIGLVASLGFAALFLIMLMFSAYVQSSTLRPLQEIDRLITGLEKGSFRPAIGRFGNDEIGVLVSRLSSIAEKLSLNVSGLNSVIGEQMDFLVNTANEMRTPLNIIRWTVDMMRFGDTGRLNKDQLELLEQLHQVDQRLIVLVTNLIEASKMERGRISLKLAPCAIEGIIDQAVGSFAMKIREKQLELAWQPPERKLPEVRADKDRLNQILINLISNAVKYTDVGGRITIKAAVSTEISPGGQRGRFIKLTIEDNGRGIPAKQQPQVFSRFFRGRNVMTDDVNGAGLGLYIVDKLVALHGGKIWFESVEGSGTTFSFTIPTVKRT